MSEIPKAYTRETPKARKDHTCCECRGVIKKGETYHRHSGIWDEPQTFKVCNGCEAIRTMLDEGLTDHEEATAFGLLRDGVFDGCDDYLMREFIKVCERRGGPIQPWMREQAFEPSR